MKSCERCGTHFGPWLRVYDGNNAAVTMRRQCRCRWWYDMFRISQATLRAVDAATDELVQSEIRDANRRAAHKGWAPSWGWAVVA